MRSRKWILAAAATVAMSGAVGAGLALAAPGDGQRGPGPRDGGPPPMGMMDGPGMPGMHPRMLERMSGELQLSEDQKQKIKGIFESARPEMEQVRTLGRQNADKLREAKPGDEVTLKVIRKGKAQDVKIKLDAYDAEKLGHVWNQGDAVTVREELL